MSHVPVCLLIKWPKDDWLFFYIRDHSLYGDLKSFKTMFSSSIAGAAEIVLRGRYLPRKLKRNRGAGREIRELREKQGKEELERVWGTMERVSEVAFEDVPDV